MRKFLSVLIILTLAFTCLCGCSKNSEETTTSETLNMTSLFSPRYELWKTNRAIALHDENLAEEDLDSVTNEGVTADGLEYYSRFLTVMNTYRSVEVAFITSETTETHYEYFDVGDDLMFVAKTDAVDNGDNTQSFVINKYFVFIGPNGTEVYSYDSATETCTLTDSTAVPYLSFADVIATYVG